MMAESEGALRPRGFVRLKNQTHLGGTEKDRERRLSDFRWLEGLGVPLRRCGDCPCGNVWGPRWLDVLEACFHSRANVVAVGVSRCLRSAEWAEALLSAYDLTGAQGVADMVRADDGP